MRHPGLTVFVIGLIGLIPTAASAQAQEPGPATTFPDLALRLPPKSFVIVTDQQGRRTRGTLIRIEQDMLSIKSDRELTFAHSDVRVLQRRTPDSVLDGGFIGLAIGTVAPLIVCMRIGDSSETPGCVVGAIGFGGLPGFAIGALVDRTRGRLVTLFRP